MNRATLLVFLVFALAAVCAVAQEPPSQAPGPGVGLGDLLVAPTRVVFEGRDRVAEVTLVNIGAKRATYRISFVQLRMGDDGKLTEIKEAGPGERFADGLIRYSPRQVTLEPNQSQTIRLQVRKPADLADGEYRSHMLLRGIPDAAEMQSNVEGTSPEGISIKLIPIYGVSIPVIVRHGNAHGDGAITDLEFDRGNEDNPARVRFRVTRNGNASLYGVFKVTWLPEGSREQVVTISGGFSVYVPNSFRRVELDLPVPKGARFENGTIRVTYLRGDVNGEAIAETEMRLP